MLVDQRRGSGRRYRFGEFDLDPAERALFRDGTRIPVNPRTFNLLLTLVRAEGHLLTKEELLNTVWADAAVEEGNLNRTISSLRKILGEKRGEARFIETVPKVGYRFVAPIETDAGAGVAISRGLQPVRRSADFRFGWMIPIAAFVMIFATLITLYFVVPRADTGRSAPKPTMVRLTDGRFDEDQAEWTADGRIRFIRFVTASRGEAWVMNADGSDQHRANDRIPSLLTGRWSHDGSRVAFTKDGEGPHNVYLAAADGANERKLPLTYPPSDWSPSGSAFFFAKDGEIFIYDITSNKSTNITNNKAFDADPSVSPDGTMVSFISDRDGNKEAYVMNVDGSNVRRVTNDPAVDAFPSISPDGTQVVFDSNRENENIDIYIKDLNDDSPPVKLTTLQSNEEHRANAWSPDGTKLVITSDQGGKNSIYAIDVEPFRPKLVVADAAADLDLPAVSPNGHDLIYQARNDKTSAIRTFDVETSASKTIYSTTSDGATWAAAPTFSSDGNRIAFTDRVDGNTEICVMNADGSERTNLTRNPAADARPAFSADGNEIYFQSNRDGNFERFNLYRMTLQGDEQRRVTSENGYEFDAVPLADARVIYSCDRMDASSRALDICIFDERSGSSTIAARAYHDTQPAVSPDGKLIAFVAQSDGNNEIYLARIDGSGLVRLTRNAASDRTPVFARDGRSIYFISDRGGRSAIYQLEVPA